VCAFIIRQHLAYLAETQAYTLLSASVGRYHIRFAMHGDLL